MNYFNYFRRSNLVFFLGLLFFVVSCTQYEPLADEVTEMQLDRSLNKNFKPNSEQTALINGLHNRANLELEDQTPQEILETINQELGSDLDIDLTLLEELFHNGDVDEFADWALENEYMTLGDLMLFNQFAEDITATSFKMAIRMLEFNVYAGNLSPQQVEFYETVIEYYQTVYEYDPDFFGGSPPDGFNSAGKGINWNCVKMQVLFYFTLAGAIGMCTTVVLCVVAAAILMDAAVQTVKACAT